MPVALEEPKRTDRGLVWHDARPNPAFPDERIGYNGYATMVFDGPGLAVEYRDLDATLLARERWRSTAGQLTLLEFKTERSALAGA
jgi:hypothetical protein